MKYAETGFRGLYRQFAVFRMTDALKNALRGFAGAEEADGALVYGYIDREAGLTLEVLTPVKETDGLWRLTDGNDEIRSFLRIGAMEAEPFSLLDDSDGKLSRRYAKKLEMLKSYDAPEDVEKSRAFRFLDSSRDPYHPDEVPVTLEKDGLKPEGCRTRITGLDEHRILGELVDEPEQDFGIHAGGGVSFNVREDQPSGKVICFARLSPKERITREDLADGRLLKEAIHHFLRENDRNSLYLILRILRDSEVWVPCNVIMSAEDEKAFMDLINESKGDLESLKGKTVTTSGVTRMKPDILVRDGKYFFPAFTTQEDMGEYGKRFSKVPQRFTDVIRMAGNTKHDGQKLAGIVINAFSEPFIVLRELFETVEKMEPLPEENGGGTK